MSLFQASFKVKHECPYRTISEHHPNLTIREWFMNDHQILEVSAPTTPTDDLIEAVAEIGTVLYEANDDASLYTVVRSSRCSLDDSLIPYFEAHNCLYVPPTIYREGWEHFSVTAFDDHEVRALLQHLDEERDIEVLSTKATEIQRVPHSVFTPVDALLDGITTRQLEALRIALDNDYFQQPRGASIVELAQQTSVARSTYEEHLRKAQNTLIANTEHLVRLVTEMDAEERFRTSRAQATPTS